MLLTLLLKTTSTALYAAEPAKSSYLQALVRRDVAAEKSMGKAARTPMALKVPSDYGLYAVSLYIAATGSTSSAKMVIVMSRPPGTSTYGGYNGLDVWSSEMR